HENLGKILLARGEFADAREAFQSALTITEQNFGEQSLPAASCRTNLADAESALLRYDDARREYLQAIAIIEAVSGASSPRLALPLRRLGDMERRRENHAEAKAA